MHSLFKNIHAIILTLAFAVAIACFSTSGAFAQATKLLFEKRSADNDLTEFFPAEFGFEVRWRATGGQFLIKVIDENDKELATSAPQTRDEDASPMVGSLPIAGRGNFKLQVVASGPWHVRVTSDR